MSATQIDFLLAGVTDSSGNALSGGKVYSYIAGTSTPATLYQDSGQATAHTNPVVLDGKGTKLCFGDGNFKLIIKDSDDNTIDTFDNLKFGTEDQDTIFAGTSTGSSNAYVLTPSPAVESYYVGLTLRFIANFANTGATTVNVSGLGVKDIKQGDGDATSTGDMLQNAFITISYNGTNFRLLSSDAANANAIAALQTEVDATQLAITNSSYIWGGTSGGSANAQTLSLTPSLASYVEGQGFDFIAGFTNTTTTPTLNINSTGAVTLKREDGSALAIGDVQAGRVYKVTYTASSFYIRGISRILTMASAGSGTVRSTSSTSYVDMTDMSCTLTVQTGDVVLIGYTVETSLASGSASMNFQITENGSAVTGSEIYDLYAGGNNTQGFGQFTSATKYIASPTAGSATYKLQWKVGGSTLYTRNHYMWARILRT